MTMTAILNEDYLGEAATNSGWIDAAKWMRSLPADFPALRQLAEKGHADAAKVAEQITAALADHAPSDASIRDTVDNLVTLTRGKNGLLIITDGTSDT